MANLDSVLKRIGEFGRYQIFLFLLLCLPSMSNGCYMMLMILLAFTPKHRCKIPGYKNDTWVVQNSYHADLINTTIPPSDDPFYKYDRCHVIRDTGNVTTSARCSEWVYDREIFDETVVTRDDLVCEEEMKPAHAQVVYYFGVLAGDLFFGMMSDSIGRRKTLLACSTCLVVVSVATAFAPEFYSFTVLEFLVGASDHGLFILACVMCIELTGPTKRMIAGILIHGFFALGLVYLTAAGFFLRHWKYIQLVVAVPCVVHVSLYWLVPESPRWLISQGKYKEAEEILRKVARLNRKAYPDHVDLSKMEKHKPGRIWQLFTSKTLAWRTAIIFLNWFAVSQIFFGVTIHMGNLGGDFYFKFLLLTVVEFPAIAITIGLLTRVGRRKVHALAMFVSAAACLLTIFTVLLGGESFESLTIALCSLGKVGSTAGFAIIYVYSSELFPTVVRNAGMGASSCVARFGGMSAPYIAKLGNLVGSHFGQAFPLIIFGCVSLTAGILTLFLPETLNKRLPDTIEDGIRFGSSTEDMTVSTPLCSDDSDENPSPPGEKKTLFPLSDLKTENGCVQRT